MAEESVVAFQFIFEGDQLKALLNTDPRKVVCTVSIDSEVTQGGKKVGALRIVATGTYAAGNSNSMEVLGCPKPPCYED